MTDPQLAPPTKNGNGKAAPPPIPHDRKIELVELAKIDPSPFNRRHFNKEAQAELTADVGRHGVLQPVLLRPARGRFELVFGERRFRAAKATSWLSTIPAEVRELTDEQVIELQCVENGKREDVHPLDEAVAFKTLRDRFHLTVETIAKRVGKSAASVYARLKLNDLCAEGQKAMLAGDLDASTALLVARVPTPGLQVEALKRLAGEAKRDGEPLGKRAAAALIRGRYMLKLVGAPFDRGDAELVPLAGPCTTCPKRTGSQPELFADVDSPDVCTDPGCFETKRAAHVKRETKRLEAKGVTVLAGVPNEFQKDWIERPAGYLSLTDYVPGTGRSIAAALRGKKRERVVFFDGKGQTIELVSANHPLLRTIKAKGARSSSSPRESKQDKAKRLLESKAREAAEAKGREIVLAKIKRAGSCDALWRAVADELCVGMQSELAKRHGPALVTYIFAELFGDGGGSGTAFRHAARWASVNLVDLERKEMARLKAEAKTPTKKSAKTARKAAA